MRAYKDYRRREATVASRQVGAGETTRSGDGWDRDREDGNMGEAIEDTKMSK